MPTVVGSANFPGDEASSSFALPVTTAVPVGHFLVVVFGSGYNDGELLSDITDTKGNDYIVDYGAGAIGGDAVVAMGSGTLATALTTTDSLTLTFTNALLSGPNYSAYAIDFGSAYAKMVARGNAETGITEEGACTVNYSTLSSAPLTVAAAAFGVAFTTDTANGWTYVVTQGGYPPTNVMDIGYQTTRGALVYEPSQNTSTTASGAALVVEYAAPVYEPSSGSGVGAAPYGGSLYGGPWITLPRYPLPPNPLSASENPTDVRVFVSSLTPAPAAPYYIGQPSLELPFGTLTFTLTINQAGAFSVEFQTEEMALRSSNWYNWTVPGKSFIWVMVGGQLIYGGRVLSRDTVKTTQKCTLTGNDFYSYWSQQMQFRDYTSYLQTYTMSNGREKQFLWAGNYGPGAPAPLIAITLMRDKGVADYFLPLLHTPDHGMGPGTSTDQDTWINGIPSANWIEFSAPISQMQSIDTLVQQMVQLGYPIGCDVFTRPTFDDATGTRTGTPFAPFVNQYVAWPRAGTPAPSGVPLAQQLAAISMLDLNAALEVTWTEDSTSQATNMWEQIGQNAEIWNGPYPNTFAMQTHHWPLTETAFYHSYVNPIYLRNELLAQIQQGDKNLHSFPLLAPVVTVPCFAPSAFDLLGVAEQMGNDIGVANLHNPDEPNQMAPALPFPPPGWMDVMRLVQADVTIPDKGAATMELTLNMPPDRQNPPIYKANPGF